MKITSNNEEMLRAAVEQFIDKTDKEILDIARATLEGHQRAIMGALTVDEIFKDRKKFAEQVFDCASTDLFNMGIQVISYTLREIKDEENYMESMGQARTAEVLRDARIGEAECNRYVEGHGLSVSQMIRNIIQSYINCQWKLHRTVSSLTKLSTKCTTQSV